MEENEKWEEDKIEQIEREGEEDKGWDIDQERGQLGHIIDKCRVIEKIKY